MESSGSDARLISDMRISSPEQGRETLDTSVADVRSTVEHQFSLMGQVHDRIRAEELAAHRRERLAS